MLGFSGHATEEETDKNGEVTYRVVLIRLQNFKITRLSQPGVELGKRVIGSFHTPARNNRKALLYVCKDQDCLSTHSRLPFNQQRVRGV